MAFKTSLASSRPLKHYTDVSYSLQLKPNRLNRGYKAPLTAKCDAFETPYLMVMMKKIVMMRKIFHLLWFSCPLPFYPAVLLFHEMVFITKSHILLCQCRHAFPQASDFRCTCVCACERACVCVCVCE